MGASGGTVTETVVIPVGWVSSRKPYCAPVGSSSVILSRVV